AAALAVMVLVALAACSGGASGGTGPETVTVLAAASLTDAFTAAAHEFEASDRGTRVRLSFAGSPALVAQLEQGETADVVALADGPNMQQLVQHHLVDAPRTFARNRLAIAVAKGNPKHIVGLADLERVGLVVVLAGPSVPAGRYARDALTRAGLVVPKASQEEDVKAVLTKVALGEADAGIVYVTDVRAAAGKVEGVRIPDAANVIATYPIATARKAAAAKGGRAFVAYLLSPAGQRTLARFGFLPP